MRECIEDTGFYNKTSIELFSNKFWVEGTDFDAVFAAGSAEAVKTGDPTALMGIISLISAGGLIVFMKKRK